MSLRGLVSAAALLGVLGLAQESVQAADPQPYSVTIAETENSALDKAMKDASQLEGLQEKSPVSPFALISRAQADVGRLETVLHSFGYYDGKVTVTIDGRPVGDADLPKTLEAVPAGSSVGVKVAAEPGPLYHLGRIAIVGDVPPDAREKLGLAEGQPAVASDVLAAGARLLSAMQEEGYALANVAPPDATQDPRRHAIDVTFKAAKGRRAVIGPIAVTGLSDVNETFVRRRLLVHSGQLYQPSKIDAARQDLASLGVFSGVSVSAGTQIAPDGSIPITYALEERPPRTVGVTGAFSTDLGGSLTTTWSHRNLFGNAEQLNLSAAATGLGGTAVKGLGYNVSAQFLKPDFLQRDQTLEVNAIALKQDLQAYDQRAVTVGGTLRRKLSPLWSVSIGLTAEHETIAQEGVTRAYTLLAVPFTAKFDSTGLTNPLTDPTRRYPRHVYRDADAIARASVEHVRDPPGRGLRLSRSRAITGSAPPGEACWPCAGWSAASRGAGHSTCRRTSAFTAAAAPRCAASNISRSGRSSLTTTRWAAPRSTRAPSSSASACSAISGLRPSSMPAR